ncbi:ribokinase [Pseudoflavonifractor sp. BIOML-A7]|nr:MULTISPECIES: ribokinase [unclassified Pseudoflavonifractor]MTR06520.1 ribokinase [Pseudoflavonifractor sp. BIOML-A15]MTR74111.1 ribokinase [Pseudoflavonifractor sp. BIOML-A18]MTS64452.1 ribokinase [Pseudoflavonifractor sp. BIOML-A5]MTS72634.1 ribokinase [Pseudoflavonifractor sp. BIOML-A8]MTR13935.1 ribokinase [Pseudoflavonifractor sp. BIOML-A17]
MLRKPNILVVGSFMMDLIASTSRAPNAGETIIGESFRTAPGGKGGNQAVQCARLGANVTMVGRVGDDDFGRLMTRTTAAAGVDVSHVDVDPSVSSGVGHILLEASDRGTQNRITVVPGANMSITVEDVAWLREKIGNYDLLMLQFELPMEVIEAVAQWARDAGVRVMVNPAPAAPISPKLLACATYLSPNEHEAAIIAGYPLRVDENGVNMDDVAAVSAAFREKGVQNLIITLGENGSIAAGADGVHHTGCVKMDHVADPTAAGDSFVAAFCTGLCAGLPQEQALAFASHAAAITVSRMGAMPSLPTVAEVQNLLCQRGYTGFDPAELDALK